MGFDNRPTKAFSHYSKSLEHHLPRGTIRPTTVASGIRCLKGATFASLQTATMPMPILKTLYISSWLIPPLR